MRQIKKELDNIDKAALGILSAADHIEDLEVKKVISQCAGSIRSFIDILKEVEKFTTISR